MMWVNILSSGLSVQNMRSAAADPCFRARRVHDCLRWEIHRHAARLSGTCPQQGSTFMAQGSYNIIDIAFPSSTPTLPIHLPTLTPERTAEHGPFSPNLIHHEMSAWISAREVSKLSTSSIMHKPHPPVARHLASYTERVSSILDMHQTAMIPALRWLAGLLFALQHEAR